MAFENNQGDFAATMQQLNNLAAQERQQEEALLRLRLTNEEILAKERKKQIESLAKEELSQQMSIRKHLVKEAVSAGKAVINELNEAEATSGKKVIDTLLAAEIYNEPATESFWQKQKKRIEEFSEQRFGFEEAYGNKRYSDLHSYMQLRTLDEKTLQDQRLKDAVDYFNLLHDEGSRNSEVDKLRAKEQAAMVEKLNQQRLQEQLAVENELLAQGFKLDQIRATASTEATKAYLADKTNAIDEEMQLELEKIATLSDAEQAAKREAIEAEFEERKQKEKDLIDQAAAAKKASEKKQQKEQLKKDKETFKNVYKTPLSKILGKPITQEEKQALEDARQKMRDEGKSEAEIARAEKLGKAQAAIDAAAKAISDLGEKFAQQGAAIAKNQAAIDTRLQGLSSSVIETYKGSYWRGLDKKIGGTLAVSPFIRQEKVVENLQALVGKGIAFNVDQRAFLQTISDKIATTFEAADGTLLKLVRIQQADTTAARLGMESALTSFLNNMYATTEYMTEAASSIRSSIYEASALMSAEEATEFEYQVQKWMGSLHSVGFSATESLATAFGKLAAGDVSGITEGGFGNLLVMAANQADLSIADLLAKGMDTSQTNRLFEAMVEYLAKIYDQSKESRVVQQQFASVYGLTASDLKAAANLRGSTSSIAKNYLSYGGMFDRLSNMAGSIGGRVSMAEMLQNITDNFSYTMASSMGNNPVLYMTYYIADLLEDFAGGINLPFISALGNGIDLNATVAQLMKIGAVSGSVIGGLGKLISSLSSGIGGSAMLSKMGITGGTSSVHRGNGSGLLTTSSGATVSTSGYVGNESGDDVKNKTMSDASADGEKQLAEAKSENEDIKIRQVDEHVVEIYELLQAVVSGTYRFHIELDDPIVWTSAPG